MKDRRERQGLQWLLRPEDSSSMKPENIEIRLGFLEKGRVIYSIAKVLGCYAMALTATYLLSRLH